MKRITTVILILAFLISGTGTALADDDRKAVRERLRAENQERIQELKERREEFRQQQQEELQALKEKREALQQKTQEFRVKREEWMAFQEEIEPKLREIHQGRLENAKLAIKIREARQAIREKTSELRENQESLSEEKMATIREAIKKVNEYVQEVKGAFGIKEGLEKLRKAKAAKDKDGVLAAMDVIIKAQAEKKQALEKVLSDLNTLLASL